MRLMDGSGQFLDLDNAPDVYQSGDLLRSEQCHLRDDRASLAAAQSKCFLDTERVLQEGGRGKVESKR